MKNTWSLKINFNVLALKLLECNLPIKIKLHYGTACSWYTSPMK